MICVHNANDMCPACYSLYMNKEKKMTMNEAVEKIKDHKYNPQFLDMLEALGLIKFDDPKPGPSTLIELTNEGNIKWCELELSKIIGAKYGTCRLEIWPEGLVLWVGGKTVWKSWESYYKKGDEVLIRNINSNNIVGFIK